MLSTPGGGERSLHQKLSSPERRKPSPSEIHRRQVEKQRQAEIVREEHQEVGALGLAAQADDTGNADQPDEETHSVIRFVLRTSLITTAL